MVNAHQVAIHISARMMQAKPVRSAAELEKREVNIIASFNML